MSWIYIIASIFWGLAAVSIVGWSLHRAARAGRIVDERRAFPRPRLAFRASLKVQKQDGTCETIHARGSNLTEFGAKVISKYPLPPGSTVFVDLPSFHL